MTRIDVLLNFLYKKQRDSPLWANLKKRVVAAQTAKG